MKDPWKAHVEKPVAEQMLDLETEFFRLTRILGDQDTPAALRRQQAKIEEMLKVTRSRVENLVDELGAQAAYARTRDQAALPDATVGRLLDGESPIRVLRQHRGLSLRALAAQAGLSPSVLSDMERGKSEGRPKNLRRIAEVLKVALDDLLPPTLKGG